MKLTTREITDKARWESFVQEQAEPPFFQSWQWGEVQRNTGFPATRLALFDGKKIVGIAQIIQIEARRGRFFHLRHAPLFSTWRWDWFDFFFAEIKKQAKKENMDFIRISPLLPHENSNYHEFGKRAFRNSPIHNMDGEVAWVLNLKKNEDELLAGMRKTTRYLIRRAIKMGVKVEEKNTDDSLHKFMRLYENTAKRQGFVPHREITEEFKLFRKDGTVSLYLSTFRGKVLAASLIIFYGNQAVYHHSATDLSRPEIPAAYLLQWEVIKDAKQRGFQTYNFWGVAPPEKPNHPWRGLSLFKTGFGGELKRHIHAQDYILSPKYLLNFAVETYFRIKKGYG